MTRGYFFASVRGIQQGDTGLTDVIHHDCNFLYPRATRR